MKTFLAPFLVTWAFIGVDVTALLLHMSPTDFAADYTCLVWFAFTIQILWVAATVVLMVAAGLWLKRRMHEHDRR